MGGLIVGDAWLDVYVKNVYLKITIQIVTQITAINNPLFKRTEFFYLSQNFDIFQGLTALSRSK